jgi:hypothetical protein
MGRGLATLSGVKAGGFACDCGGPLAVRITAKSRRSLPGYAPEWAVSLAVSLNDDTEALPRFLFQLRANYLGALTD